MKEISLDTRWRPHPQDLIVDDLYAKAAKHPDQVAVSRRVDGEWLHLPSLATVEVTSEDPAFPVEAAFSEGRGWRASSPGSQTLRLVFDAPVSVRRVLLEFREDEQLQAIAVEIHIVADGVRRKGRVCDVRGDERGRAVDDLRKAIVRVFSGEGAECEQRLEFPHGVEPLGDVHA